MEQRAVLMPARAFFVFGPVTAQGLVYVNARSNAREGIFCFWTGGERGDAGRCVPVLMPARAFFVFGPGSRR